MPLTADLLPGTLDLLLLQMLAPQAIDGWGVALRIQRASKDVLRTLVSYESAEASR
jgi:PadR family transcriptional regulator PadR